MAKSFPIVEGSGARYLTMPQIMPTGGTGQVRDVSAAGWFPVLQPVKPVAPAGTRPWQYNRPVGANVIWTPGDESNQGSVAFEILRAVADSWDLLRIVIETVKDRICSAKWEVRLVRQPGQKIKDVEKAAATDKDVRAVREFLRCPDGDHTFEQWLRMLTEDMLVLDAMALYKERDVKGRIASLRPIDGATIFRVLTDQGFTPRAKGDVAYQQVLYGMPCYSADTEVLTSNGWKLFKDVDIKKDLFATRNLKSREFAWQKASAKFDNPFDGDLIRFHSRHLDIAVTPNHKMIVNRLPYALGGGGQRFKGHIGESLVEAGLLAEHQTGATGIPISSRWEGKEVNAKRFPNESDDLHLERLRMDARCQELRETGLSYSRIAHNIGLSPASAYRSCTEYVARQRMREPNEGRVLCLSGDDYCALMGLYLSEGSCSRTMVAIAQRTYSRRFEKIREFLQRINNGRPVGYDGSSLLICSKSLVSHLRPLGHSADKYIPLEVMNATPRQLRIFWDHYQMGDGSHDRPRLFTCNRKLADQLQEVAQKMGHYASIRVTQPKDRVIEGRTILAKNSLPHYRISLHERVKSGYSVGFKTSKIAYRGRVYCVEVPNHTLYVRRNGYPAWSGNSINLSVDDLTYVMRNPRTHRRYGLSAVEQILITINLGLSKQRFDLNWYTEGNMPEAAVFLPPTVPPNQVLEVQQWFDSMLAGDLAKRRRITFLPGFGDKDSKPNLTFFKEALLKNELDEWLFKIICYTLGVTPQNVVKAMNRASAEAGANSAEEEGLDPKLQTISAMINQIIQVDMGYDRVEFSHEQRREVDALKQAEIDHIYLNDGVITRNECREDIGKDEMAMPEMDEPGMITQNGFVALSGGQADVPGSGSGKGPAGKLIEQGKQTQAQAAVDQQEKDRNQEQQEAEAPPRTKDKKTPKKANEMMWGHCARHEFHSSSCVPCVKAELYRVEQSVSMYAKNGKTNGVHV